MIKNLVRFGPLAAALALVAVVLPGVRAEDAAPPEPERLLRHVVLFQFKEDATADDIRTVEEAFAALPDGISEIADFEWGTDVSVENLADGFTHCFFVSFRSEADRDAYLPHPAHKDFVAIVGQHLERALVVDYWTTR